ncbi:MAG: hypothetical protein HY301_07115 [Verrucomicrobia bacterium]|nr:hypothetical protein [Verrucomicrobiota bacterium]
MFLPIIFACFSSSACSIPVFRYALDRWPADNFRLEVSAADAKDEAVAKFIRNFGSASELNLEIVRLPADQPGPSRLLRPHSEETAAPPVWTGTLTTAALAPLTNSPARIEIVRRMLAGNSAVWVLVESGDRAADDAAARTLEKRLRYLEQVAQIPPIDPTDPTSKLGPGPKLAVKFSVLRVGAPISKSARSSTPSEAAGLKTGAPSDESAFLQMLAGPKSGLAEIKEPWVAAIFGRGRVLGAWPAKGFGDEQIEEVSLFLLGACSCQVKKLNPGWDLLLHADWDEQLRAIGYQPSETSDSSAPGNRNSSLRPETVSITGGDSHLVASTSRGEAVLLGGGALLLVLLGGLAWRRFES